MYVHVRTLARFGARIYAEVRNLYQDASPIFTLTAQSAPTCAVHGMFRRNRFTFSINRVDKRRARARNAIYLDAYFNGATTLGAVVARTNNY